MLTRKNVLRYGAGATLLALAARAHAEVPSEFTSAITDAIADVGTMAGALVGVSAVAVAFMLAIKYVKRIPRAG